MNPRTVHALILPAAFALLGDAKYDSLEARAEVLAAGLQESDFGIRVQRGGPAVSFWQFERIGIEGVLTHPATAVLARKVCDALGYAPEVGVIYEAMQHNDILGATFARLVLLPLPQKLPGPYAWEEGWRQYVAAWRPGRPRPERWNERYKLAWSIVRGEALAA